MHVRSRLLPLLCALLAIVTPHLSAQVRVVQESGKWKLLRNGQPYFVKGAGGNRVLESLAESGGNSLRLWSDDNLGEQLDAAHKKGLTVAAGIWLGQVRQGFDWSDAAGLIKQREQVRATVEKYRNHPALLIWVLGNEMEDPEGKNGAVWTAINNLARMVKEIDPDHPTMTVVAEIGGDKVKNFHALCPDVDIFGLNSYGGVASLGERYKKLGGMKPYIVTEFGPPGIWEIKKNEIGAYPEPTSTEKAAIYRRAYEGAVLAQPDLCLGSYAFLWGHKQEVTSTWFSMFTHDGAKLGAAETLSELWTGKPPENGVPRISSLQWSGPAQGKPGAILSAALKVADPDSDPLRVTWVLQKDPGEYGTGGDHEEAPSSVPDAVVKSDASGAQIRLPADGGLYRLFAYAYDEKGGAAVANLPLRVDAPEAKITARKATLPLALYGDGVDSSTYIPAGWMGEAKAIRMEPESTDQPHEGKTALRVAFEGSQGWGGVVWQSPAGDWGDRPGGYDLTGAKRISFWARGEAGGEVVTFQFGIIPKDKKFSDTAKGELKVTLEKDWKQYHIPVEGKDLTRIKTGFVWTAAAPGKPFAFHLDDIRWE
ncbi:MAG: glycoside hydrolase family 2 TIM barrel-domain containing protein [Chthoniobacteraceae bacterium]